MTLSTPTNDPGSAPHQWLVEAFRFTGFIRDDASLETRDWWQTVTGAQSEESGEQRRLGARKEEGPWANGRLILATIRGRLDWIFRAANQTPPMDATENSVGEFTATLPEFRKAIGNWLPQAPSLHRIALGAVLLTPVPTMRDGVKLIDSRVEELELGTAPADDLLYQINRRRPSKAVPSMEYINRLTKWSVIRFNAVGVHLALGAEGASVRPRIAAGSYAAQLEIDLNTAAEHEDDIPGAQLGVLFDELVEMALEIGLKGNLP